MRNISFSHTVNQIRDKSKTVTRRIGWQSLKEGTLLMACEKCQGLKKGQKINRICTIKVIDVRREVLQNIDESDIKKEGFPHMSKSDFINMFCKSFKCKPSSEITRIEFMY